MQGSGGAILFATFILAMIGLLLIIARRRWRDPWWRFVLYGLAVSIVPGAITNEPFHELRLMGLSRVSCWCLQSQRWNGCLLPLKQSRVYSA